MNPDDTKLFDKWLEEQADKLTGPQLLAIPGIYEILSEELVNAWIDHCNDEEE
jgi:hypothetical protein|tara:strand:+ start:4295 stop:4453 length:159 start_codon:yes stop_codon:yes gene_type:complete